MASTSQLPSFLTPWLPASWCSSGIRTFKQCPGAIWMCLCLVLILGPTRCLHLGCCGTKNPCMQSCCRFSRHPRVINMSMRLIFYYLASCSGALCSPTVTAVMAAHTGFVLTPSKHMLLFRPSLPTRQQKLCFFSPLPCSLNMFVYWLIVVNFATVLVKIFGLRYVKRLLYLPAEL